MVANLLRLRQQLQHLPDPILKSDRFLLWKYLPVAGKKPKKIPFYASGHTRGGNNLDTPEDLSRLVSFEKALAASEPYDGIGFAVVGQEGIGAFDLDNCLTPEGDLIEGHPGSEIARVAEEQGAYIEISPSGKGLRIIGPSGILEAYSKDGLEYWGSGRYVTVTGSVWANPKGWSSIENLRRPLRPRREERVYDEEAPIITKSTLRDLKEALAHISAEERETWIRIGMSLKPIGDKGKSLWVEWSATSEKFEAEDADRVWESFRPERTSYKLIFNEAKAAGWDNPGKQEARADEEEVSSLRTQLDLGELRLYPTEFVLDGFLPVGVTLVAGAWGAGKSTNLIPLFASVAHLAPEEWGFRPQLRRHVIWITEAPDQARDTLYSLAKAEGSGSWAEFKEWFHLLPARRRDPKGLAAALARAVEETTRRIEVASGDEKTGHKQFAVHPVIVLDTTSANLDLENESDNSEVGAAMAALKEKLPGIPVVLVGHTPKALIKSDVSDMTFRGAGAWEADAVATYYLVFDEVTGMRFMALRKSRFAPDYTEVSFGNASGRETVDTPWGEPQSKTYMHGIPEKSTGEERKAAQQEAREEKKEQDRERVLTYRQARIIEEVGKKAADGVGVTRTTLREAIGGKAELIVGAIDRLTESGLVKSVRPPQDVLELLGFSKGRAPDILIPGEVDPELFYETVRRKRM